MEIANLTAAQTIFNINLLIFLSSESQITEPKLNRLFKIKCQKCNDKPKIGKICSISFK